MFAHIREEHESDDQESEPYDETSNYEEAAEACRLPLEKSKANYQCIHSLHQINAAYASAHSLRATKCLRIFGKNTSPMIRSQSHSAEQAMSSKPQRYVNF